MTRPAGGATLVEVLLAVLVVGVASSALASAFFLFSALRGAEEARARAAHDALAVVAEARALALPATRVLAARAFTAGTYTSGADTLVLELPAIDSSGNIVVGAYDYAAIYREGGAVVRVLETDPVSARQGGTRQLAANLSALSFGYDDPNVNLVTTVSVAATTSIIVKGQAFIEGRSGLARLRNVF